MKRITALALALIMLLSWTAALAEKWPGTQIRMKNMNVKLIGNTNQQRVRLNGTELYFRVGDVDGVPTLQLVLKYGEDLQQELDCVFKQEGSRLMVYSGGIAGVYYIDLEDLVDVPGEGETAAAAIGEALSMFGEDPDGTLETQVPVNEKGFHRLRLKIPPQVFSKLLARLQGLSEDDEALENSIGSAISQLDDNEDPIEILISYHTGKRVMRIYFLRGKSGARLYGTTTQKHGDISFDGVSPDEPVHNLLDMDQNTRDELIGEIGFLSIKIAAFLKHSSLKHLGL